MPRSQRWAGSLSVLVGGCVIAFFPETNQRELEAITH
jgi:hypothetical protein